MGGKTWQNYLLFGYQPAFAGIAELPWHTFIAMVFTGSITKALNTHAAVEYKTGTTELKMWALCCPNLTLYLILLPAYLLYSHIPRLPSVQTSLCCWTRLGQVRSPSALWSGESGDLHNSGQQLPIVWMPNWSNSGETRRRLIITAFSFNRSII